MAWLVDLNGNHLLTWGSYGTGDSQFDLPAGIDTDAFKAMFGARAH